MKTCSTVNEELVFVNVTGSAMQANQTRQHIYFDLC